MEITILGVLIGAILPLFGYLAVHYLASSRDKESRYAKACNDFRGKVIDATSDIPKADVCWDNEALINVPIAIKKISNSVEIFKYFLKTSDQTKMENTFLNINEIGENKLPSALSTVNVMYSGGQQTPEEARTDFWDEVEKLKSYARNT